MKVDQDQIDGQSRLRQLTIRKLQLYAILFNKSSQTCGLYGLSFRLHSLWKESKNRLPEIRVKRKEEVKSVYKCDDGLAILIKILQNYCLQWSAVVFWKDLSLNFVNLYYKSPHGTLVHVAMSVQVMYSSSHQSLYGDMTLMASYLISLFII